LLKNSFNSSSLVGPVYNSYFDPVPMIKFNGNFIQCSHLAAISDILAPFGLPALPPRTTVYMQRIIWRSLFLKNEMGTSVKCYGKSRLRYFFSIIE